MLRITCVIMSLMLGSCMTATSRETYEVCDEKMATMMEQVKMTPIPVSIHTNHGTATIYYFWEE